jgi:hypothetical protein
MVTVLRAALRRFGSALPRWLAFTLLVIGLSIGGRTMVAIPGPVTGRSVDAPKPTPAYRDLWRQLLDPFIAEALKQRASRAVHDPDYARRVDAELNHGRISFLLVGYGETHEPPYERDTIGSITIVTLDYMRQQLAEISLTHDARAPSIERYTLRWGIEHHLAPSKIDRAYKIGGFPLMGTAVENATGLAIDFQMALDDVVIKRLVDDALDGLDIDNPQELSTLAFYVDGVKYPGRHFTRGKQRVDGLGTLCYLKALNAGRYDRSQENNLRKVTTFQAMRRAVESQKLNPIFWARALHWLQGELERKTLDYDFDAPRLLMNNIDMLAATLGQGGLSIPPITRQLYLADSQSGDGGFEWITGSQNPIIKDELQKGIYADKAMVVPVGNADPYADNLATGYWAAVRRLVKQRLTERVEHTDN